jgi:hypothetical protein
MPARPTDASGSGLLPTPVAKDDGKSFDAHMAMKDRMGRNTCSSLAVMARSGMWPMLPTPRSEGHDAMGKDASRSLLVAQRTWASPAARDWRSGKGRQENGHTPQLCEQIGGQLNPEWVGWLMGFPAEWTALSASATRSSRKSSR